MNKELFTAFMIVFTIIFFLFGIKSLGYIFGISAVVMAGYVAGKNGGEL